MSTPRPPAVTSRLNTGGYGAAVSIYERRQIKYIGVDANGKRVERLTPWAGPCKVAEGTVSADGSLSITPRAYELRHYRRAVMRGAGVYRWGLWAFLGARRATGAPLPFSVPSGEHVQPHRVIVRGPDVLAPELPHVDVGRVAPGQGLTLAGQRQRAVYYAQAVMRGAGVYQAGLWAMLAGKRAQTDPAQAVEGAALGVNNVNGQKRTYRGSGVHLAARYREFIALRYRRFLRSIGGDSHPRRLSRRSQLRSLELSLPLLTSLSREESRSATCQRPPRRAPRPLYSRAIPPAAPLAPPAL